jgi:hypothetical protein
MNRNFRLFCVSGLLLASFFVLTAGFAEDDDAGIGVALSRDYPSGIIRSDDAADAALRRTQEARAEIEKQFADKQRVCYSRFFVNSCLANAKEDHQLNLTQVKRVEIEANEFKRRARAEEHDRIAAEKAAQARSLQVSTDDGEKSVEERVAAHEERLKRIQEEEQAKAPERARNIAAYEKKVSEAEERKREAPKTK